MAGRRRDGCGRLGEYFARENSCDINVLMSYREVYNVTQSIVV